jgi:copper(I)-binding protein
LLAALALSACGRAGAAAEAPAAAGRPEVREAWSRPALQGRTGVLYFTIAGGAEDDRLTRVDCEVAARAELHRSFDDDGVLRMRPVGSIQAPAGAAVVLAPAGYHVMLVDLARSLRPGETFGVTLTFEKAGPVEATATVRGSGRPGAAMDGMSMPDQPAPR